MQLIGQDGGGIDLTFDNSQRRALGDVDEAADVKVVDVVHHLFVSESVARGEAAVIGGEKKLANFFVDGHRAEGGVGPFLRGG